MADKHTLIRYSIHMQPSNFWQWILGGSSQVIVGTGSSLKDGELLIHGQHGVFHSINYTRVLWMQAEVMEPSA